MLETGSTAPQPADTQVVRLHGSEVCGIAQRRTLPQWKRGLQRSSRKAGNPRQRRETTMRPRKTIVCVEDNEQILSVRKFLLETRGYRVLAMGSGAEALDYLRGAIPGSVDLLLADVIMPQMDGNELVRRAKQLHPGLPTLLISGTVSNFDRAAAADAFLPKGACTPAEMLDRIRILVARKRGPKKQIQVPAADVAAAIAIAS